jgi:Carboxypeptidase regulatory-like domain
MAYSLVGLTRGRAGHRGRVAVVCAVTLWGVAAGCSSGDSTSPRSNPVTPHGGSITGTVVDNTGGIFSNTSVVIKPSGGVLPSLSVLSGWNGLYLISDVPPGSGAVTVQLPGNEVEPIGYCTLPAPMSYTGLSVGDTVTVNITIQCVPSPWDY